VKNLKIAGGFLNQTPFDWVGNEKRIRALFDAARAEKVSVLVLPELCISGYGCEDAFLILTY
jgi:NAD+ synthase (glutamine-hydrolysing)